MVIKHVSTTEYNGKEVRIIRMTGRWDSVIGYRFNVKIFSNKLMQNLRVVVFVADTMTNQNLADKRRKPRKGIST
jgi:hypothetical protein